MVCLESAANMNLSVNAPCPEIVPVIRILSVTFAMLLAVAPAWAYPKLESRMLDATVDALMKSSFGNDADGARAGCVAAKSLLTAKTPKYLAAYSEICFALASPSDGNGQKRMCPNYLRAIEIWRATPPPIDDEDTALKRAGLFHSWKSFAAKNCGAPLASTRTDMGPITSIFPGSRLKTQDGLSYIVPDGWTIESFDETVK